MLCARSVAHAISVGGRQQRDGTSPPLPGLLQVLIVVNPTSGNRRILIVAKEVQEALKTVRLVSA